MTDETPASPSYSAIVLRQLLANRWAVGGLVMVAAFFLLAFFAPFLAHRLPLVWFAPDGAVSFPLLREFFAPKESTEAALEIAFNFALLFLPLAWLLLRMQKALDLSFRLERTDSIGQSLGIALAALACWGLLYSILGLNLFDQPASQWDIVKVWQAGSVFGVLWRVVVLLILLPSVAFGLYAGVRMIRPRGEWVPVLILALLVAQPFLWIDAVNDPTPYRRLEEESEGWGVFPLIPYGPFETGFGPKVAPSWWTSDSDLTDDHVADWRGFAEELRACKSSDDSRRQQVWQSLSTRSVEILNERPEALLVPGELRKQEEAARLAYRRALVRTPALKTAWEEAERRLEAERASAARARGHILDDLNELLRAPRFYTPTGWQDLRLAPEAWEWKDKAAADLTGLERERMNRYALDALFPRALKKGVFERRKRERHAAGFHLLGTDNVGRDVLARVVHGGRVSLAVGFISVGIAACIGVMIGSCAGYFGGWVDIALSRFIEIIICFPSFFLILTIMAMLEKRSILNIMLVIGFTGWTGIARLIRGEVLKQRKLDYVASAQALGVRSGRVIFRHILPNAIAPVLVSISFGIAGAILTESGLSFLGFGVAPPTATWGQLLNQAREAPWLNWWLALFPGLIIFLSVTAYNLVGEGLRDALDPRLRR